MPDLLGRGSRYIKSRGAGDAYLLPPRALLGEWRKANYSVKEA